MAKYFVYKLINKEPLRIANDSTSQSGQTTTLDYIPGTTIRGYAMSQLANQNALSDKKEMFFDNSVRFMNAYISENNIELCPSPKGFYEDKKIVEGKKKIENLVINGDFSEGYKRAAIGSYTYFNEDTIHYYSVDIESDMKIKINNISDKENQKVFRNEYVVAGNKFVGYIAYETDQQKSVLEEIFTIGKKILLGNSRDNGLGKCEIIETELRDEIPYEKYLPKQALMNSCYMMLLSNTVMRNDEGEYCGIDWQQLSSKLDITIQENQIISSTSVVDVKGYNRTWGCKLPSVVMYEKGSVFHISFTGELSLEKLKEICDEGIGERKNEGFGRIIFIDSYENIVYKEEGKKQLSKNKVNTVDLTEEDKETLKIAAKGYVHNTLKLACEKYIVKHPLDKGTSSNSKLGIVESCAIANKYNAIEGIETIKKYFEHALKKEQNLRTQQERTSVEKLSSFVNFVIDSNIEDLLDIHFGDHIMGIDKSEILSEEMIAKEKLFLLVQLIRYDNKGEGK